MISLSRRAFLAIAALFAPAARLRALAQPLPEVSVAEFLRLSQRLTGRAGLDSEIAATYLNAILAAAANSPLIIELTRGPATLTAAHVALERTILESWYTGTYTLNGERRLATHTGALMWSALGVPAAGTCVGAFGAWSRKR
jgi:hypothetical protein